MPVCHNHRVFFNLALSGTMPVMRTSPHFGLFLLTVCLAFNGSAKAQHMNAADGPCRGPATTADASQCFTDAWHAADNKLNQAYSRVQEVLGPDETADLKAAQRLWLKFRDANCAAERNMYGRGTAAPVVYSACMEANTRQRVADIKIMYGWRMEKWGKSFD
jgi:uncharacterized protein YecT (DUF1311 family)